MTPLREKFEAWLPTVTSNASEQDVALMWLAFKAAAAPLPITGEYVRSIFNYDPETGIAYWRAKTSTSAKVKIGDKVGTVTTRGYYRVRIFRHGYPLHRLIWLYMTDEIAPQIDHINGVRNDNRWINLRKATNSQNQANRRISRNNKSGFKGVFWAKGRWTAALKVNGVRTNLGRFDTREEASAAYAAASKAAFGEFARW